MNAATRIGAFTLLLSSIAATALAQQPSLPPGKWWKNPQVVERLQLGSDQQQRLDAVFRNRANDLIDAKGDIEKRMIELRGELDRQPVNRPEVQKVVARLNEARNRLLEKEIAMLLDMREVLSAQQWNQMSQAMESRGRGGDRHRSGVRPQRGAAPERQPGFRAPRRQQPRQP